MERKRADLTDLQTLSRDLPQRRVRGLETLVLAHLVVVSFQIPLRAIIIDTTFLRDILLFATLSLWGLVALGDRIRGERLDLNWFDLLFGLYTSYGFFTILLAVSNGLSPLNAVTQFRNSFLPAALYFPSRKAFATSRAQVGLVNLFFILALVLILDVIIEFVVLQVGISGYIIPWYPFIFRVSDRFVGNELQLPGYIRPEDSPVLGLLGYPTYTVVTMMALFAFIYPFVGERELKDALSGVMRRIMQLPVWIHRGFAVMAIVALLILNVTTHMFSAFFVMIIVPILSRSRVFAQNLVIVAIGTVILLAVDPIRYQVISRFDQAFNSTYSTPSRLDAILEGADVMSLIDAPIPHVFFGSADIGDTLNTEVRLLFFTSLYGFVWLFLFLAIFTSGFAFAIRIVHDRSVDVLARFFALGTLGLLAVYLVDMGHYARPMWAPNIDIWAVCLGTLSAIIEQHQATRRVPRSSLPIRNSVDSRLERF